MIVEQERRAEYQAKGHKFVRSLPELEIVLTGKPDPPPHVVFVDDQYATGGQAEAQLRQWSGMNREAWPQSLQGEQNIEMSTLAASTRSHFENSAVSLAFISGTTAGKTRIEAAARELGYNTLKVLYHTPLEPRSPTLSESMRKFLTETGIALLRRVRYGTDPIDAAQQAGLEADALGYGGTASVVVTPFSAPSHVITAFWCPGIIHGQPWIPLFLRRGYRSHLVLG
jgi:hypothetical protein